MTNVAAATAANDAVNLGQLNSALSQGLAASTALTDARIAELGFDLRRTRRDANAGTAAAMAVASIPQAYGPGMGMFGGGIGVWNGEVGFAVGMSKATADGDVIVKGTATVSSRGEAGAAAGLGFAF